MVINMKANRFFLIFIAAAIVFNSCGQSKMDTSGDQIILRLKEFYVNYITESSKAKVDVRTIDLIKRKYCTVRFLNKIEEGDLDYDPILNAQDCDIKWLETLSIVKDA